MPHSSPEDGRGGIALTLCKLYIENRLMESESRLSPNSAAPASLGCAAPAASGPGPAGGGGGGAEGEDSGRRGARLPGPLPRRCGAARPGPSAASPAAPAPASAAAAPELPLARTLSPLGAGPAARPHPRLRSPAPGLFFLLFPE